MFIYFTVKEESILGAMALEQSISKQDFQDVDLLGFDEPKKSDKKESPKHKSDTS